MKALGILVVVIGLVGGGLFYYSTFLVAEPPPSLRTAPVIRGDLLFTISATGTVEPEEVVDVGAQVAGKISSLKVDYGSVVQEGTVLAQIDDALYKAQVDQARATLQRAKADLLQAQAKLLQAEQELRRAEKLRQITVKGISDTPIKAVSESDYDAIVANQRVAKASVAVAEAVIQQAEAALRLAETNLGYTVIKSPVKGVIVDRRVNVGQTVVASLNAPSLFLIAKDLRRMQVWAAVNEADIGRIHTGQPVRFRVDAYPGEEFRGKVAQIRLNATMTQNVVTYTVVVETDNDDLKLRPYLTASLQFEVDLRRHVLQVPNAALRWRPRAELVAPDARESLRGASFGKAFGKRPDGQGPPGPAGHAAKPTNTRDDRGRLWVKDGQFVRPIEVQIGATDGSMTEVSGSELQEGLEVVIGEVRPEQAAELTNPFAPKVFRRTQKPQQP